MGKRKYKRHNKKKVIVGPIILFVIVIISLIVGYSLGYLDEFIDLSFDSSSNENISSQNISVTEGESYDDFQIHFLELGNAYSGDSCFIKANGNDILIDAGSLTSSSETLINYINNYCEDGILEYVIATHAHKDHIAGLVGNTKTSNNKKPKNYKNEEVSRTGIFYYYQINNLIDFSLTDATSDLYTNYLIARDYIISNGCVHYTAGECFNNENGASRVIDFGNNITMEILYNPYYFTSASKTTGGENNYSVCTMFNYLDHHFLLTGDLEIEGEEGLANYYDGSTSEKTLPHCDLFKAGHHGSPTSSNECLLSKITPDICCVCCCAGSNQYTNNYLNQFPSQDFINRIAKYTDKVYVTSCIEYDNETKTYKNVSLNGNIVVSSNGLDVAILATNLTKLKDSAWFNKKIYVKDNKNCSAKAAESFYTELDEGVSQVTNRTWPS